jgi:hypothetical protein
MSDISPSLSRLAKLTVEMFTDEYGVPIQPISSVGDKLSKATDLIAEAKATLDSAGTEVKVQAAVLVDGESTKAIDSAMVEQAKAAVVQVVEKAVEVADAVHAIAKTVQENK